MWRKRAALGLSGGLALAVCVACGGASGGSDSNPEPRSEDATGAVTSVSESERPGENDLSLEEFLRGRVPGLQIAMTPDGGATVRIRGGGGREPLVVIDGVPVQAETLGRVLTTLNPNDIASVEVLRDVASTAMYGSRGAYGVLLITTKKN